ncbi:MAG: tetratricopeptide repeat protein [Treponema sp.]|nr:tetratricopeptide repeat protein [Treponema sp.]
MKKLLLTLTCLATGIFCFGQSQSNVEIRLYNEINSFFNAGYYPGVIDQVEQLEKQFPDSVFIIPSLLEKSEALFHLQRYQDAEETLNQILSSTTEENSPEQFAAASYWYGRVNSNLGNYDKAIMAFYNCQKVKQSSPENKLYSEAAYYCGKLLYNQKNYAQAIPQLSFIYSHGVLYSVADYSESVVMLLNSLNKNGDFSKTVDLYEKLPETNIFGSGIMNQLQLQAAIAYENTEKYMEAYDLYCKLIETEDKSIAVTALQKAYGVAHNHNLAVKPEILFTRLEKVHSDTEALMAEFWVRLGIDYYEKGNFSQCRECFNSVIPSANQDLHSAVAIYEAKMKLDEGGSGKIVAEELLAVKEDVEKSEITNLKDAFYSQLMICYSNSEDWNNTIDAFTKIQQPEEKLKYIAVYAYYNKQAYKQALQLADTKSFSAAYSDNIRRIRAGCYAKTGDYQEAEYLYSWLDIHQKMTLEDRLEYSKVLLAQKKNQKAIIQAIAAKQPLSEYVAGLASYNMQNWADAEMYLNSYLVRYSKTAGYTENAYYYKAFAVYKQGKNQQAYDLFLNLGDYTSNKKKLSAGYEAGAVAALIQGNYKNAAVMAEKRINVTVGKKQQEAILFCADVYADGQAYDSAVALLAPYTESTTDFALQTTLKTANIYEKAKQLDAASLWYEKVYDKFTQNSQAEEALYRTGEMYYSAGEYKTADTKFTAYIKTFGNGKFTQAAYYYSGECNLRIKDYNRAILQNKLLLSKFPKTIYGYGAFSNLLQTYYEMESYGEALETARNLLKNFEKQAVADGIGTKIQELEKINSGVDRELAEKISQFEKYGKETTVKGRIAGTELVKLYAEEGSTESMQQAVALAEKLLSLQNTEEEMEYGAANGDFAGEYYYHQGNHKKAADLWLKAAEYYRASGKNSKSAEVLYSAADSFISAGLKSDAQATAQLLINLYPETVQAQRVNALFK